MEATNQSSRAEPVDDGQSHLTPQLVDTSLVVGRIVQVKDESVLELITKQEKWITLKVRLLCVILGGLVIIAHNTVSRLRHSVTHVTPVWRLGPAHYKMLQRPWTWMESSEWPSVHSCMWDIGIKMYLGVWIFELQLSDEGQGLFSGEPPLMKMDELLEYLNSYQKILGYLMCLFTYRSEEVEFA